RRSHDARAMILTAAVSCVGVVVCILPRALAGAPLFPYTTLFRSGFVEQRHPQAAGVVRLASRRLADHDVVGLLRDRAGDATTQRSEEHTSELQSLRQLVCRLLLEKKKKTKFSRPPMPGP